MDLIGDDVVVPEGVLLCDQQTYEAVRIEAGVPRMGRELTEQTIPAEATGVVERAVSFTKGCYTGQELVAAHRFPRRQRRSSPRRRRVRW